MENEKNNQSIVNFAFVVSSFMAAYVASVLFALLADSFGVVAHVRENDFAKNGIPVAVGLLTFVILFFNKKIHVFADECVSEIRKVVWPSQRDTAVMTLICCIMVVVAGMGFGLFDFMASQLVRVLISR